MHSETQDALVRMANAIVKHLERLAAVDAPVEVPLRPGGLIEASAVLRRCPFCTGADLEVRAHYVECGVCGCQGPYDDNVVAVLRGWNDRPRLT